MDQRICIKFCVKNGIKCSKTLELLKVAYGECTVSQKVFKSVTSSSQKVEKRWMTMLALDGPARQQPMKTLKQWRKLLWRIVESLLEKLLRMSAYQLAHAMQFFRIFWVWTCGSEVRSKITEFWPAHSSLLVRNFLAKNNTVIMPQPPHSPDLAPCDFSCSQDWRDPWLDGVLPRLRR